MSQHRQILEETVEMIRLSQERIQKCKEVMDIDVPQVMKETTAVVKTLRTESSTCWFDRFSRTLLR